MESKYHKNYSRESHLALYVKVIRKSLKYYNVIKCHGNKYIKQPP